MSKSREQVIRWLNSINVEGLDVADIGAGEESKWVTNYVHGDPNTFHTYDVDKERFGVDYEVDMNNGFGMEPIYDAVFAIELFEHLWNPFVAIQNVRRMLKSGGMFYFANPVINPPHDDVDYLRLTDEWWEKVLMQEQFTNITIQYRYAESGKDELLSFYDKEGMRMSKARRKSEPWKIAMIGVMGSAQKP